MSFNNKIYLKGNLTKDPEYKTVSEKDLVTFRIAVNESIGQGKEETSYFDVDGWDSHARYAQNVTLQKGDRVHVEGSKTFNNSLPTACRVHSFARQAFRV